MTDRPILFSTLEVRALLSGAKTQTRRLAWGRNGKRAPWQSVKPGDRLWVRESWCDVDNRGLVALDSKDKQYVDYRATPRDGDPTLPGGWGADPENVEALRWRSPIHMPRLASRLTLTVTDVRVEPLQDISEADVLAEGLAPIVTDGRHSLVTMFVDLWNSINGHRAPWNSNPDVVALTFTVEERNIDG